MKSHLRVSFAMIMLVAFTSCTSENELNIDDTSCFTDTLSFQKDILPIFEANCFSCHNEEDYARKADGNLMTGYKEIKQFLKEDLIIGNIEHRQGYLKMPYKKEKLDSCDIIKIKTWAAAGAKE